MVSGTYCPLPFGHLLVSQDGTIAPCCITEHRYQDHLGRPYIMTRDSLAAAWHSNDIKALRTALNAGQRPSICSDCWHKESLGLKSHRLKLLETAENPRSWMHDLSDEATDQPISLTIRYGNLCNLKCRICVPWASSKWIEEWNSYRDSDWVGERVTEQAALGNTVRRDQIMNWPNTSPGFWAEFDQLLPLMQDLMFSGGEPFMVPKQLEILRACAASGHASHIDLNFHTNGTLMDADLVTEVFPRFRSVTLQFSIDGIGAQFEYQRHGADWHTVDANLRSCVSAWREIPGAVVVNLTVSAMNVLYLHDYGQYFDQIGITVGLNHLVGQIDLDPANLPVAVRHHIADHLERCMIAQPLSCYRFGSSYAEVVTALRQAPALESTETFVTATRRMDQYRGEDFAAVFPEMADLLGYRKHLD